MTPSIVLLGNLLVDDVVLADGTTRMGQAGGAVLYNALGATLWNARPGLVSVVGDDYPAGVLQALRQRGADLSGVHPLGGSGVRTWVLYEGSDRRLIHRLGCPTHEQVSPQPSLIPAEWSGAPAFHLAPMPFDVQRALVTSLRGSQRRFVSVDPHLPVTDETLDDWREVLADVDAFFPGEDELLLDRVRTNPERALPRLVSGRLRFVVFKRGANGGILYDARSERFHRWTARTDMRRGSNRRRRRIQHWIRAGAPRRAVCGLLPAIEPSSQRASPSKAGDLTRCWPQRALMPMPGCVGGMAARPCHERCVHVR